MNQTLFNVTRFENRNDVISWRVTGKGMVSSEGAKVVK
jgi:hypothetical protein